MLVMDRPELKVSLYETNGKKKLSDIANEASIEENVLKEYNKWAKRGSIPDDKSYMVAIPGGSITQDFNVLVLNTPKETKPKAAEVKKEEKGSVVTDERLVINGVEAIKALPRETVSAIANRSGIDVSKFISYNDISIDEKIRPGVYYFLKKKKKKIVKRQLSNQAGRRPLAC
ncbi:MAG: LysM peptidoglycan-binding domain-containing protein [Cyclobacteriaceae bacterium]